MFGMDFFRLRALRGLRGYFSLFGSGEAALRESRGARLITMARHRA
jgi:hypothetical protein